jgi:hypothetical protein
VQLKESSQYIVLAVATEFTSMHLKDKTDSFVIGVGDTYSKIKKVSMTTE